MSIALRGPVNDSTPAAVDVSFYDEDGASVVPTTIVWTLTNGAGTVINSRSDVAATPAAAIVIALGDADTKYADGPARRLLVEAEYTSTVLSGHLRDVLTFPIVDLRGV